MNVNVRGRLKKLEASALLPSGTSAIVPADELPLDFEPFANLLLGAAELPQEMPEHFDPRYRRQWSFLPALRMLTEAVTRGAAHVGDDGSLEPVEVRP